MTKYTGGVSHAIVIGSELVDVVSIARKSFHMSSHWKALQHRLPGMSLLDRVAHIAVVAGQTMHPTSLKAVEERLEEALRSPEFSPELDVQDAILAAAQEWDPKHQSLVASAAQEHLRRVQERVQSELVGTLH